MGLLGFLVSRREGYDEDDGYDDEDLVDDDADAEDEDVCPAFSCGCKWCALMRRLCHHEAGHVIAHLALDVWFDHVAASVGAGGDSADGVTSMLGEARDGSDDDHLVITCAGAAAEELVYGGALCAEVDDRNIAEKVNAPNLTLTLTADEAAAEAAEIVDEWSEELDAVAAELFIAGYLTASECAAIAGCR